MIKRYFIISTLCVLVISQAVSQELEYLGSYSFLRASSEHSYVSEFRLWKTDENIQGVFIFAYGLSGDPIAYVEKILSGTLNDSGKIKFKTKWYQFSGEIDNNQLQGILRQYEEIIWGGVKGSNLMTLKKGTLFHKIKERPKINSKKELGKWFNKLITIYKKI